MADFRLFEPQTLNITDLSTDRPMGALTTEMFSLRVGDRHSLPSAPRAWGAPSHRDPGHS